MKAVLRGKLIAVNAYVKTKNYPPFLFGLVGIYHVPLPAEYFSAFSSCLDCCVWVALKYSGSLWFLFIVEVPLCGWGWTSGLSRFPG